MVRRSLVRAPLWHRRPAVGGAAARRWIGSLGLAAGLSLGFSGAGQAGDWNTLGGAQWTPVAAFDARDGGGSPTQESTAPSRPGAPALVRLRALVSAVESHRDGYDAYHLSAPVPPPAPPSRMTLDAIRAWVRATPGQQHAIGRYQIIPETFDRLIRKTGLPGGTVFSAAIQDRLADLLIAEAGHGAFLAGRLARADFLDALAAIWAGLPDRSGRSVHHGIAGNRATISRAAYEAEMARIFPAPDTSAASR